MDKSADLTAATGSCACIGMMGPGLGGGMGPYEGHFGLVLDNIIDMTVVIADGSKITVSESSHPDLYVSSPVEHHLLFDPLCRMFGVLEHICSSVGLSHNCRIILF